MAGNCVGAKGDRTGLLVQFLDVVPVCQVESRQHSEDVGVNSAMWQARMRLEHSPEGLTEVSVERRDAAERCNHDLRDNRDLASLPDLECAFDLFVSAEHQVYVSLAVVIEIDAGKSGAESLNRSDRGGEVTGVSFLLQIGEPRYIPQLAR